MTFEWVKNTAKNSIFFEDKEEVAGKGKYFKCRFLQPGLVKYDFGVCVLEKETIDKFIDTFVGVPVIIGHQDLTVENADKERVGTISKVWYDSTDGWYWCEGVIFQEEAINLIKNKNFNVSCQYIITEYSENKDKKLYNANPYDKVILNGVAEHLAIVENARYQGALISVNALEVKMAQNEDKFVSVGPEGDKHPIHIDMLKDKSNKDKEKKEKDNQKDKKEKDKNFEEIYQKMITPQVEKQLLEAVKAQKADNPDAKVGDTAIDSDRIISLYTDKLSTTEYKNFDWDKAEEALFAKLEEIEKGTFKNEKINKKNAEKAYKEVAKKDSIQLNLFSKNDIIQAINEIKETDMFKNLFGKKEKKMEKDEIKAIFLECLTELKASNEAEEKKEEDAKNEEDKKEEEEKAENKCKNEEEPDYKKLYEDLKAKMEAANEEKEEKEDKEAENKKAKNSIDEQMAMFCKEIETGKSDYVSKAKAIELGSELF